MPGFVGEKLGSISSSARLVLCDPQRCIRYSFHPVPSFPCGFRAKVNANPGSSRTPFQDDSERGSGMKASRGAFLGANGSASRSVIRHSPRPLSYCIRSGRFRYSKQRPDRRTSRLRSTQRRHQTPDVAGPPGQAAVRYPTSAGWKLTRSATGNCSTLPSPAAAPRLPANTTNGAYSL